MPAMSLPIRQVIDKNRIATWILITWVCSRSPFPEGKIKKSHKYPTTTPKPFYGSLRRTSCKMSDSDHVMSTDGSNLLLPRARFLAICPRRDYIL